MLLHTSSAVRLGHSLRSSNGLWTFVGICCASLLILGSSRTLAQPPAPDTQATEATETPGEDDPRVVASRHFRNGVELFEESAFEDALVEFREAYATFPNPVVLYNIGQTFLALRRYTEAGEVLREYLERMGANIAPARRHEVETQLEALRRRIGRIRFTVNIAGAEIVVDGRVVGTAPFADPVPVNIGSRRIIVRHEGYQPVEQSVSVAADQEVAVTVQLEVARVGTVTQVATQIDRPMSTGMRVAMWSTVGATVVLAGVSIWSTADAYAGDSDYRANPTREGYLDGQTRLHRTYGLMAATAAVGVGALVIGLIGGNGSGGGDDEEERPATPPATTAGVSVDRNHAMGVVMHRF
jgi:hypothetical protein